MEKKPHILLVDDDDDALTSLLLALRSKGYELFTSRNGIEALEVLNNKPVYPVGFDNYFKI